ncbi:hypothetical protein M501DRAFT_992131 [Patellaria atrata CBS 101060]|uniref:Uncharacterized protein n=1 Tax=Patellaria atrata CBS 101060 TaxID=1346257 RepID=A0A9P4VR90_9PEZI|nr:hypothetical protein M501DRAFT_992131 [Patellaria atrata CBS 101060]
MPLPSHYYTYEVEQRDLDHSINQMSSSHDFVLAVLIQQASAYLTRFRDWYPRYSHALNYIVENNCSAEYAAHLSNTVIISSPELSVWDPDTSTTTLIQCILDCTPEYIKSNFASAQVLLGLMPTALATLGPSVQETALLSIVGKRPLLSLLIAFGSPAVYLERSFHYRHAINELKDPKDRIPHPGFLRRNGIAVLFVKYILIMAAIANIAIVSYELPLRVSFSLVQNAVWLPAIWAFVGSLIHVLSACALRIRVSVEETGIDAESDPQSPDQNVHFIPSSRTRLTRFFITLEKRGLFRVTVRKPTFPYILITWLTTILTGMHLLYGTLVFSSMIFISVVDAAFLILRFMASVVVCRLVLLGELGVLRQRILCDSSIYARGKLPRPEEKRSLMRHPVEAERRRMEMGLD